MALAADASESTRRAVRAPPCLSLHVKCLAGGLAFCVAAQGHAARRRLSDRYISAVSWTHDPLLRQARLNRLHEGAGVSRAKEAAGRGAQPDQAAPGRARNPRAGEEGRGSPAAGRAQAAGRGGGTLRREADRLAGGGRRAIIEVGGELTLGFAADAQEKLERLLP